MNSENRLTRPARYIPAIRVTWDDDLCDIRDQIAIDVGGEVHGVNGGCKVGLTASESFPLEA